LAIIRHLMDSAQTISPPRNPALHVLCTTHHSDPHAAGRRALFLARR